MIGSRANDRRSGNGRRFAKQNRLATIVGTRTAGDTPCECRSPGWDTSQGECIEGRGVEPDVAIDNSAESLATGADSQLEKASDILKAP